MGGASPTSYHNYLQVYDSEVLGDPERERARRNCNARSADRHPAILVRQNGMSITRKSWIEPSDAILHVSAPGNEDTPVIFVNHALPPSIAGV